MISQIELPNVRVAEIHVDDYRWIDTASVAAAVLPAAVLPAAVLPAMAPPEMPSSMRRQPTPILLGPFRWSVWTIMKQSVSNLVRRSRYSLGFERD